ncbi:MAG: hypothetical protein GKR90_28010 [Pseudomonadales bacterium]|nr:hypothetical protein [Pseudomonadales bacterium]
MNTLNLGNNNIDISQAKHFFENSSNIHTLILCNCLFHDSFALLAYCYKRHRTLRTLDLSDNSTNHSLQSLVTLLSSNTGLQELNIENNKIAFDMRLKSFRSLKHYSLHALNINGIQHSKEDFIVSFIRVCINLRKLYCSANNINDDQIFKLQSLFKNIQVLDLSNNLISSSSVKTLSYSFGPKNLKTLKLSGNSINDDSLIILLDSLQSCYRLKCLDIGYNKISSEGIAALSVFFKKHPYLSHIDLSGSSMSEESADMLGESLSTCLDLEVLHINDLSVDNTAGIISIVYGFRALQKLQHLSFGANINESVLLVLSFSLKEACSLQKLELIAKPNYPQFYHSPYGKTFGESYRHMETFLKSLQSCAIFKVLTLRSISPVHHSNYDFEIVSDKLESYEDYDY